MTERLLQYIWQFQYFSKTALVTTHDEPIHILKQGSFNQNQGPDFSNALVRINGNLWAGNIELHLRTTDWSKHRHTNDHQYANVVLHVVWENDEPVNEIPVLELKDRVSKLLLDRYELLMQSASFIPCNRALQTVPPLIFQSLKDRLLAERLQRKAADIRSILKKSNFHWEETIWILLARNFGMKVNADAFESVASALSLQLLTRHKHNREQLEALLLGQAGLLDGHPADPYIIRLKEEFSFLRKKYRLGRKHLAPLFLRMRPGNFPGIRLSQLASLIHQSNHLFSRTLEAKTVKQLFPLFSVTASSYWDNHYKIGEYANTKPKRLGQERVENIIINTVIPLLFEYGNYHGQDDYRDKAIAWLGDIAAENNTIIHHFRELGIKPANSGDTQSLLELKTQYCDVKRCLECSAGNFLLKRNE